MPRFTSRIPDPRPSRAHPEHRKLRKELEKEHGYGWIPPVLLGLLGVTLAFDVAKDVEKHEQRHKQREEEEQGQGQERKRRRRQTDRDRRRTSEDEQSENGEGDGGYDSHDAGESGRRRRGRGTSRNEPQPWARHDDIDLRNYDYEAAGASREATMARAESLERGEAGNGKWDGGLDRADQLEKGEGGVDDRGYDSPHYGDRPRRSIAYDEFDDGRSRFRRHGRRRDEELEYEYVDYSRGRRMLDERRSRPRPRRRSSDW